MRSVQGQHRLAQVRRAREADRAGCSRTPPSRARGSSRAGARPERSSRGGGRRTPTRLGSVATRSAPTPGSRTRRRTSVRPRSAPPNHPRSRPTGRRDPDRPRGVLGASAPQPERLRRADRSPGSRTSSRRFACRRRARRRPRSRGTRPGRSARNAIRVRLRARRPPPGSASARGEQPPFRRGRCPGRGRGSPHGRSDRMTVGWPSRRPGARRVTGTPTHPAPAVGPTPPVRAPLRGSPSAGRARPVPMATRSVRRSVIEEHRRVSSSLEGGPALELAGAA